MLETGQPRVGRGRVRQHLHELVAERGGYDLMPEMGYAPTRIEAPAKGN